MKEIFKLILLLVILSGCIENDEEIILNNSDLEDVSEYKRAEDLICQFSERKVVREVVLHKLYYL